MKDLALTLPWGTGNGNTVINNPLSSKGSQFADLGSTISTALNLVFAIAAFMLFIWLVWGAVQYIFAGGDKEGLSNARKRMIAALIGFVIVALSFALAQYVEQIFNPQFKSPISFEIVKPAYAQTTFSPVTLTPVPLNKVYGFGNIVSLGDFLSGAVKNLVFPLAGIAIVIYFLLGAFNLLISAGDKEKVGKAREMITHAIIGFVLLMLIFAVLQFAFDFFGVSFPIISP